MNRTTVTARCANCATDLAVDQIGPCPTCGEQGRKVAAVHLETAAIAEPSITTAHETWREYYERNPYAFAIVIAAAVASPFVGVFLLGPAGFVVGAVLSGVSLLAGNVALKKTREIIRTIRQH